MFFEIPEKARYSWEFHERELHMVVILADDA